MGSPTRLKDITLGQQNCKVLGRLIRLWDAQNITSNTLISIDGVILDEEITIPKKLENEFRPLLTLSFVYMFVDINAEQKIYLPPPKIHASVQSKHKDLIGVISHVGPYDYAGKMSSKKNRKLKIRNKDEQEQEIVLWGEHGETFDEASILQKSTNHEIVVAIFVGLTAGSYLGKIEAASSSATQIYFDSEITEIYEYHKSYQWEIPTLQQQMPQVQHLTPLQAAGKLYKLEEISALPVSSFELRHSKMYKLPLTITDDSGTMDTVAFNNVAEDLVTINATQSSQNMKIDATDHAIALDTAIGKRRLFHIAMNTKCSSHFSINYVLKKSHPVENEKETLVLPTSSNHEGPSIKQLAATDEGQTIMEHCSKEDQYPTTPPSSEPLSTTPDNNTKDQIITTNRSLEQLRGQPTTATNRISATTYKNHNPRSNHTTYLQAISIVNASKSPTVYVSVQGKSAADDLSNFKPTQTHTVSYMKNKIPHIDVFLKEQDFKNNEI
uniref:Replication protein A OB domain-containing protein n=1 Tax=Oryza punctata TaxID=4537 RepID=A0A0E0LNB8_ORYPU